MPDVDLVKGTVHVVDDDPSFRTALERRLRTAGYIVATYPSAEQLLNDLSDCSGLGCIREAVGQS
jgi:FixJ family two-component response regulator